MALWGVDLGGALNPEKWIQNSNQQGEITKNKWKFNLFKNKGNLHIILYGGLFGPTCQANGL